MLLSIVWWNIRWLSHCNNNQVYGSAMEANQDKLGKAALHQYRLYDIEEITIENNVHSMVKQNPLTHILIIHIYLTKGGNQL